MAITEEKLATWAQKHDLKKLHKALKEYNYKIRLAAVRHLGLIKHRESLPHLEMLIDDSFLDVLQETHQTIKDINPSHPSLSEFRKKIDEKELLEEKRKHRTEQSFTPISEEEERKKLEEVAKRVSVAKIYQKADNERHRQLSHWKTALYILGIIALAYLIFDFLA